MKTVFWKTKIEKGLKHPVSSCVIQLTPNFKAFHSIEKDWIFGKSRVRIAK